MNVPGSLVACEEERYPAGQYRTCDEVDLEGLTSKEAGWRVHEILKSCFLLRRPWPAEDEAEVKP